MSTEYWIDPEPNGLGFYSTVECETLQLAFYRQADTPQIVEVVGIDGNWSRKCSKEELKSELQRLLDTLESS